MKRKMLAVTLASALVAGVAVSGSVEAVGEGPNYGGNETIQTSMLHTYDEMVDFLKKQDAKQDHMELEVIGQTVKGRDLYLVKYVSDESRPTVLFLTQQHGNEQLSTEGALQFIKNLGANSKANREMLSNVNILIVPMFNADGAMGDVNFPLDDYVATGRQLTRYNAVQADLNRDHVAKVQPETKALHNQVLKKYHIDYMIDLHHQGTRSEVDGELVSGSILYPTNSGVDPAVVEKSKRLGSVVYHRINSKGWGHIGKYVGGSELTIGRNGIAKEYGIATLLFEMRGMSDHYYESYVLGQKSNGYLIKQSVETLTAATQAIADGSIADADISFWNRLPEQKNRPSNEEEGE